MLILLSRKRADFLLGQKHTHAHFLFHSTTVFHRVLKISFKLNIEKQRKKWPKIASPLKCLFPPGLHFHLDTGSCTHKPKHEHKYIFLNVWPACASACTHMRAHLNDPDSKGFKRLSRLPPLLAAAPTGSAASF